jgi:hypothetical protein
VSVLPGRLVNLSLSTVYCGRRDAAAAAAAADPEGNLRCGVAFLGSIVNWGGGSDRIGLCEGGCLFRSLGLLGQVRSGGGVVALGGGLGERSLKCLLCLGLSWVRMSSNRRTWTRNDDSALVVYPARVTMAWRDTESP